MKRTSEKIALFFFLSMIFSSCGNTVTDKKMAMLANACWACDVNDGGYAGKQFLTFHKDGEFHQQDELIFASEDSGFVFRMDVLVFNEGMWKMSGDSLFLVYRRERLTILPDAQTFEVRTVPDSIHIDRDIKDRMSEELLQCINQDIGNKYEAVSDSYVFFGRITEIKKNSLLIKKGYHSLRLTRNGPPQT